MNNTKIYLRGLVVVQAIIAYEWGSSGWGKVMVGEFVGGMTKTLGYFASQNPYLWYKDFLVLYVIPNADAFGFVIQWSEVIIAAVLFISAACLLYSWCEKYSRLVSLVTVIALLGGMLMSANFYFAAGWTSPSTHGINIVMFWIQAGLSYVWFSKLLSDKEAEAQTK